MAHVSKLVEGQTTDEAVSDLLKLNESTEGQNSAVSALLKLNESTEVQRSSLEMLTEKTEGGDQSVDVSKQVGGSQGYGRGKARWPPLPAVIGVELGFGRAYVVRQRMLKKQQLEQQQQQTSIGAKQDSSTIDEKPVPVVVPKPEPVNGALAMYIENAKSKPSSKNRR